MQCSTQGCRCSNLQHALRVQPAQTLEHLQQRRIAACTALKVPNVRFRRSFREAILKEAAEAFPEDAAAYSGLTAAPGGESVQPQQQQPQQQQGDASPAAAAAEPAATTGPAPLG